MNCTIRLKKVCAFRQPTNYLIRASGVISRTLKCTQYNAEKACSRPPTPTSSSVGAVETTSLVEMQTAAK